MTLPLRNRTKMEQIQKEWQQTRHVGGLLPPPLLGLKWHSALGPNIHPLWQRPWLCLKNDQLMWWNNHSNHLFKSLNHVLLSERTLCPWTWHAPRLHVMDTSTMSVKEGRVGRWKRNRKKLLNHSYGDSRNEKLHHGMGGGINATSFDL